MRSVPRAASTKGAGHGGEIALGEAVQQCHTAQKNNSTEPCTIVVGPGEYTVACPPDAGAYIDSPGAVDLSGLQNVVFGGASASLRPTLFIDYVHKGCPAVAARFGWNVTVQNLVIDCQRLPFSMGTVTDVGPTTLAITMAEPPRLEWNTSKYPWLNQWFEAPWPNVTAAVAAYNFSSGVARFRWPQPWGGASAFPVGRTLFVKHFVNMQAWGVYGFKVSGGFVIRDTTLLTAAGMGYRCDFCNGSVTIADSAVTPAPNRPMSTTADGIHFMHHTGSVVLRNTTVSHTGDDNFNVHSNFFVVSDFSADRRSAVYIDETGPGWIPGAPVQMVGDTVAWFSRATLQQIGPATVLLAATSGFGQNATVTFRDPVPSSVRRYDMFLSTSRAASLDVEGCTFDAGGRGLVISASPVRIVGNTFTRKTSASVLFLEGGCGAYEDYTEGPFSSDVLIQGNNFSTDSLGLQATQGAAVIQLAGCVPVGTCSDPPGPTPPKNSDGPIPLTTPYAIPATYASIVRLLPVVVAGPGRVSALTFFTHCNGTDPAPSSHPTNVTMALFGSDTDDNPTGTALAVASGFAVCNSGGDGWATAPLTSAVPVSLGKRTLWIAHYYSAGPWNTVTTTGSHHFFKSLSGMPGEAPLLAATSLYKASGVPVRLEWETRLGEPYPMPPCQANGTGVPPIVQHSDDTGPGRIQEPGQLLGHGYRIYRNVTVRANAIEAPHTAQHFVDVGATDGVVVLGNNLSVAAGGRDHLASADIAVYSSINFNATAIAAGNRCGQRPCTVATDP